MTSEWAEARLENVCSVITDGAHFSPKDDPTGLPMASVKDLTRHGIRLNGCRHISQKDFDSLKRQGCCPVRGDVLIAKDGNSALDTVCVHELKEDVVLLSSVAILRPNERVTSGFLRYYLDSPDTRALLKSGFRSGSAIPRVVLKDFRRAPVPVPPLPEQRAIAHILGTLDDKIELNRRMCETLEVMARALFKSWFVDFEPVRAKTEGRWRSGESLPGLPAHLFDLFPDSFEDSEFGEIPKGWEVVALGRIADVVDCLHSKKPERHESGFPLLQLENIRDDGVLDMSDVFLIEEMDYHKWISRIEASPGDCVITNVGRFGAVSQIPAGQRAALGRNMTCVRCRPGFPFPTYLIEALLSRAMKEEIRLKLDSGTILDSLNVRSIPLLRCVRGTDEILDVFESISRPLRARMERLHASSKAFAALRDTLLPKLISGEMRVPSGMIDRVVADATGGIA